VKFFLDSYSSLHSSKIDHYIRVMQPTNVFHSGTHFDSDPAISSEVMKHDQLWVRHQSLHLKMSFDGCLEIERKPLWMSPWKFVSC